jgi:PAS domain S-box-containing protein
MQPISILVVEDSPLDAELTSNLLERAGIEFRLKRVETREDLKEEVSANRYDVILSDYALPDFAGVEALRIVRERWPDLPFIFVSGILGEEIAVDMLKHGATDYVLKDRLQRLVPAIQRALTEASEKQQRLHAETALRVSELRYRSLVEAAPQLVWSSTASGAFDYLNLRWVEYTGVPEDLQFGDGWLEVLHPDDRERVLAAWMTAIRGEASYDVEYRIRGRDGKFRWFKSRGVPIRDNEGNVTMWFGTSTDIEDQKQAEDALRRQSEALARSNAELQQFAYIASHDLQEPLRSVISYTQLLQRRYKDRLDGDAEEFMRYAVEGASRMQQLIRDLLEYSRAGVDADRTNEVTDCESALRTALENLSSGLREANGTVTYDALPTVAAGRGQLALVFQNLVSNAIKYRREEEPPRVHISAEPFHTSWRISVQDNGVGFDHEDADRIFGIFQRLHGRDVPGTGMGLAICKRIVEAHGGRIWAQSEPNRGSTFTFTMPAANGTRAAAK